MNADTDINNKREDAFVNLCCYKMASYIGLQHRFGNDMYQNVLEKEFEPEPLSLSHAFSMTKSFVGLVYVNLLLTERHFPHDIVIGKVPLFANDLDMAGVDSVKLVDLINHTSGLVSGKNEGKFNIDDALFLMGNPTCTEIIESCLHEFKKPFYEFGGSRATRSLQFKYNNYGSFLFGMLLEDIMRQKQINNNQTPDWNIKDAAKKMGIFGNLSEGIHYKWHSHPGYSVRSHTMAFYGLQLTGSAAMYIGKMILNKHKNLLEFIQGDREVVVNGRKFKNKHRVPATCRDVCPTPSGNQRNASSGVGSHNNDDGDDDDNEPELEVDYSYGFWIPVIPGRRVISMIGMLGQFIAWDLDNDFVVVRMHYAGLDDISPKNKHKNFVWDAMKYLWVHFNISPKATTATTITK